MNTVDYIVISFMVLWAIFVFSLILINHFRLDILKKILKFKEEKVELKVGQDFRLDMKEELGDNSRVTLPHKEIFEALKIGDKNLQSNALKPEFLNSSTATNIAIIKGKSDAIKGRAPFAPFTKPE